MEFGLPIEFLRGSIDRKSPSYSFTRNKTSFWHKSTMKSSRKSSNIVIYVRLSIGGGQTTALSSITVALGKKRLSNTLY